MESKLNAFFQQALQKRYQKDNMIHYITKSELIDEEFDEKHRYQSQSITATRAGVMPQVQWPCLVWGGE